MSNSQPTTSRRLKPAPRAKKAPAPKLIEPIASKPPPHPLTPALHAARSGRDFLNSGRRELCRVLTRAKFAYSSALRDAADKEDYLDLESIAVETWDETAKGAADLADSLEAIELQFEYINKTLKAVSE